MKTSIQFIIKCCNKLYLYDINIFSMPFSKYCKTIILYAVAITWKGRAYEFTLSIFLRLAEYVSTEQTKYW